MKGLRHDNPGNRTEVAPLVLCGLLVWPTLLWLAIVIAVAAAWAWIDATL